jgi:excisionase family DNA binding protein
MPRTARAPAQHWDPVPDAATYARVSSRTIRRWIADGKLPARRVGPRLLQVNRAELDKLIRPVPAGGDNAA